VGDNAENFGANHGRGDWTAIGYVGNYHDDSEYNAGKSPGPKLTHMKLFLGADFQTGKHK
jgi:hypothetical protein